MVAGGAARVVRRRPITVLSALKVIHIRQEAAGVLPCGRILVQIEAGPSRAVLVSFIDVMNRTRQLVLRHEVLIPVGWRLIAVSSSTYAARYLLDADPRQTRVLLILMVLVAADGGRASIDQVVVEWESMSIGVRVVRVIVAVGVL